MEAERRDATSDYGGRLYYNFKLRLLCLLSLDRRTSRSKLKSLLIIFGQSHTPAPLGRPFSSCRPEGRREGSVSRPQNWSHQHSSKNKIVQSIAILLTRLWKIKSEITSRAFVRSEKTIHLVTKFRKGDNRIRIKWTNVNGCKAQLISQIADLRLTHGRGVQIPLTEYSIWVERIADSHRLPAGLLSHFTGLKHRAKLLLYPGRFAAYNDSTAGFTASWYDLQLDIRE